MNASTVSALLAQRAQAACRRYLPHGRKQGRYWCAGDVRRRARLLAVRAPGAARHAGEMHRCSRGNTWRPPRSHPARHRRPLAARGAHRGAPVSRRADSAGFLARRCLRPHRGGAEPVASLPAHRRLARRGVPSREGHSPLPVPGIAVPPLASVPHRRLRLAALPGAGRRRHRRPTPGSKACTAPGSIRTDRSRLRSGGPARRSGAFTVSWSGSANRTPPRRCWSGEGIETVLSLVTAVT